MTSEPPGANNFLVEGNSAGLANPNYKLTRCTKMGMISAALAGWERYELPR